MTKHILGGWDVTHNVTAGGNRTVQSIGGNTFDENGNLAFDGYSEAELNGIMSVLPISNYGTHNYLPVGVGGTFLGSSENSEYRYVKPFLENDGTMVVLRPGTNGSSRGLYYSSIENALNTTNLSTNVNTTRKYHPVYFPAGYSALSIYNSDETLVVGKLFDDSVFPNIISPNIFTSFTNGTMNDEQHTGFVIPLSTVTPTGGSLKFAFLGYDGYIYYISYIENTAPTYFDLTIVRVLYNHSTGTYTSEELTGWSGKIYTQIPVGSRTLKMAGRTSSTNPDDEPYMLIPPGLNGYNPFMAGPDLVAAQDKNTKLIRIKLNGDAWLTTTTYNVRPQHGICFVFDPSTKVVTLDPYYQTRPASVVVTDTGSELVATGNLVPEDSLYFHLKDRNIISCYNYVTEVDTVFCIFTPNLGSPPRILKGTCRDGSSMFDALNWRKANNDTKLTQNGYLFQTYGSVISTNVFGLELLPNNTTKQSVRTGTGSSRLTYAEHKSTADFQFTSVTLGTINGYEPTINRQEYQVDRDRMMFISSISGSTVTTNGGIFVDNGLRLSTALSYDSTASGSSQRMTVNEAALTALKNSEIAKTTAAIDKTSPIYAVLYCPQQAGIPALVLISALTTTRGYYYRFVEVNVNTRTGNISTITFKRLVSEGTKADSNYQVNRGGILANNSPGITIYDAGSFYFIGGADPVVRETVGNNLSYLWTAVVDKSTGQYSKLIIRGGYTSNDMGNLPIALPNIGFGYASTTDFYTRIVFQKVGTTMAEYDAYANIGPKINVVSQEVAEGFILYFTEATPVMITGKSFTMPITSIDLSTIKSNPANRTFRVYIVMVQGLPTYKVTTDVMPESETVMWIGEVKTNSTKISEININKRSRLDIYGMSYDPIGSSFPISYGLPSSPGTINW